MGLGLAQDASNDNLNKYTLCIFIKVVGRVQGGSILRHMFWYRKKGKMIFTYTVLSGGLHVQETSQVIIFSMLKSTEQRICRYQNCLSIVH